MLQLSSNVLSEPERALGQLFGIDGSEAQS